MNGQAGAEDLYIWETRGRAGKICALAYQRDKKMSANEKPIPPGDYDCCESGCEPCVWDIYRDELRQWQEEQKNNASQDDAPSGPST